MKNAIVFLLVLGNVGVLEAQYQISAELISNTPSYKCKIEPTTGAFEYLDLITWILPDGQFKQQEIGKDANGNVINFATFTWTPYKDPSPNPNKIQAFVAEKGGTGTPPPFSFNFFGQFGTTLPTPIFPTTQDFQLNRSWEFSPGSETFLLFTYKPKTLCGSGTSEEIQVNYPSHLTYLGNSSFNSEMITDFPSLGYLKITNFTYNQDEIRHILLNFITNPLTPTEQAIQITAQGKFCGTPQFVVYNCTTAVHPHDPNKKTVDIDKICVGQDGPIKLTYTIQFHNDGKAHVMEVNINDLLQPELTPESFHLIPPMPANGIDGATDATASQFDDIKLIKLSGPGLPGLNQTNPYSYSYDQTIFRFSFEVYTKQYNQENIDNDAKITFFDTNGNPLPSILTEIAQVVYEDQSPPVDCYLPTSEALNLLRNITIKPNPFQDQFDISLVLLEKSRINLEVRDIWGRLITTLASGEHAVGAQNFSWDGTSIPEGVYLIFLRTENGVIAKRMIKG